ncbi:TetR/AcrR family transcriptional regulator [Streptosporangium sp. NPDC049644]|uniref:TetR/AcrR family transcriptional regulator n=1 Tax=Streptosporangium sp. NPDC049644 TaxID=3155507 RepID=UPI00342E1F42
MTDTPHRRGADRTEAIMRATLELGQEIGYARLSIEAVAARAGASKQTIYRRWSSKGALLLDSLLSLNEPGLDYPDTGDIVADLRAQIYSAIDLLAGPPFGPLFKALIGEAQHDPQIAAALNERFIAPQADKTVARLRPRSGHGDPVRPAVLPTPDHSGTTDPRVCRPDPRRPFRWAGPQPRILTSRLRPPRS